MAAPYAGPDLATILQNLSAYTGPATSLSAAASLPTNANQPNTSSYIPEDGEIEEYAPSESSNLQSSYTATPNEDLQAPQPSSFESQPRLTQLLRSLHGQSSGPNPSPKPTALLPSSQPEITAWPPALRHVTKLSGGNPAFIPRIKKMISSQHEHERQWWLGREQLVKKLQGREASRRKLEEALAAVTGNRPSGKTGFLNPEEKDKGGEKRKREDDDGKSVESNIDAEGQKELVTYDRKVLKACKEMFAATEAELENLGVPFFGRSAKRLLPDDEERGKLQKKMLVFLEELAGD